MAGPATLAPLAIGEICEGRVYSIWNDQEFINKFYFRVKTGTGVGIPDTQTVALAMQTSWQTNLLPLVPTNYFSRMYWAAKVHSVVAIAGPPPRWLVSYTDQTVVLGEGSDFGTNTGTDWLPPSDTVTMNRLGVIRNKNWRPSVRIGPVPEPAQDSGALLGASIASYNNALTTGFMGLLYPTGTYTVDCLHCLFSPALAVGKVPTAMEDASQNVFEWRANRFVGTQKTRKMRASGY